MSIYNIDIHTLGGERTDLRSWRGRPVLAVNVASRCGLTPQYEGLERLARTYAERGLIVAGFPCDQFGGQEPGTNQEIAEFCSTAYSVTFPMFEKIEVNGPGRHALYEVLTRASDAGGEAGDVTWNFEKFLIDGNGDVVERFRPRTAPEDPQLIAAIERVLPAPAQAGSAR